MDDLNRAIEVADMVVEATPQDYPDRAGFLNNLGNRLSRRFGRTGAIEIPKIDFILRDLYCTRPPKAPAKPVPKVVQKPSSIGIDLRCCFHYHVGNLDSTIEIVH